MYNFNSINLLSIIYNLFYVPLISIIIFPLSLISFIFNKLIIILNIFINILEFSTTIINKVDIFKFTFKTLPLGFYFIYYLVIIIFFRGLTTNNKKLTVLLVISLLIHYLIPYLDKNDYLLMIDVGQGDSILIHTNNKNILIDTGGIRSYSKKEYSIVKNTTIPLLKKKGIKKIDYLILTHGDYDHLGDTINLINNFKVKKILINSNKINNLEKNIIKNFSNIEIAKRNYYFKIGDAEFLQLNSNLDEENDSSLVFLVGINNKKILLMGDASIRSEKEILSNYNLSNIDILKAGHHGSRTSSSEKFIKEISPKLILISAGVNNKFNHPHKEVINLYKKYKIKYRITSKEGSIKINLKKE